MFLQEESTDLGPNFNSTYVIKSLVRFDYLVRLGTVSLGKVKLGKVKLGKVKLGKVKLGKVKLG
jgi:hypothetical protein